MEFLVMIPNGRVICGAKNIHPESLFFRVEIPNDAFYYFEFSFEEQVLQSTYRDTTAQLVVFSFDRINIIMLCSWKYYLL